MINKTKISVVIPSYCSQDNLPTCLESIRLQINDNIEVIVVDCSPSDNVLTVCERYEFVKFIKVKKRFNPGEGRNIGANASSGEILVFLDADVSLQKDALQNIALHMTAGAQVFGGALELNKQVNSGFSACAEHYYFNHESQSSRKPKQRDNLSSAFMIIKKSTFFEFEGFSDIPRMQDTELTERIAKSGIKIQFFPDVVGYQVQDSPLLKVFKKIFITGNNLYFIRYHRKNNPFFRLFLCLILPILMLAKVTRISLRNLRYSFSLSMLFLYTPTMYICGLYWMAGFYRALLLNDGIMSGR